MSNVYKTYINGFDEELGGGIQEGSIIILAGPPGSLKSTVAYNMAFRNAKEIGTKTLYITLDKNKEKFMNLLLKLGMDNAEGKVLVYDLNAIRSNLSHYKGVNWWEPFKSHVKELKYSFDFNILILDSLQLLELVVKIADIRTETNNIFKWLEDELKVTGILISEMSYDSQKFSRYDEELLADGIIHLSMQDTEFGIERRIRCVKLSGVAHSTNYFHLILRNNEIYAEKITGKQTGVSPPVTSSDSFSF